MSGQWERFVERATDALRDEGFVDPDDDTVPVYRGSNPIPVWVPAEGAARAVLATVGPLIAEDTRERLVTAAARAVEREKPSRYYCPASGEVEQKPGGGFDVCCDQAGRHQPLSEAAYRAVQQETATQIMQAIERRRLGRRRRWFRSRRWSAEAESAWSSGMWQAAGIAHRQGRDARSKAAS